MKTPAITKPKPTAATIRQINAAHDAVVNAARDALQNAIRAGELLIAVKDGQDHGDWEIWLANNCPNISDRTARLYMKLAKEEDKLTKAAEENGNTVADLSVREAQKLLATPLTEAQRAERAKKRAAAAAEAAKKNAEANKPTGSPDLKDLMDNCGADEIVKPLQDDPEKLEEVAKASIVKLTPDKVYDALIGAWRADQLHDLAKLVNAYLATLTPTAPSSSYRRPLAQPTIS